MKSIKVIIIAAFFSCSSNTKEHNAPDDKSDKQFGKYNLSKPSKVYTMPDELNEISGITKLSEAKFACIEDQHGKIYIYNIQSNKVEDIINFGPKGDYEDIIKLKDSYFILRSDGMVFKYSNDKTEQFSTPLKSTNNTEGMCYDPVSKNILIACKDDAGSGLGQNLKAIYSFSLENYQLSDKPFIILDVNKIDQFNNSKGKNKEFSPSGIGVNPLTKNIFILSARGSLIVETDRSGNILDVSKLKNKLFIQPEGISFDENGTLYISNEGKKDQGNILEFKYQ